jgi:hypothetical protein
VSLQHVPQNEDAKQTSGIIPRCDNWKMSY